MNPIDGGDERPRLLPLLEIESIDRDLFRAPPAPSGGPMSHLFGGLVAAQALRAALHTVDADRAPHSLHGYFLRPGKLDQPSVLRVDRDRDGRSISARRVTVLQDGEVILSMSASFQIDIEGPVHDPGPPRDLGTHEQADPHRDIPAHREFEVRGVGSKNRKYGLPETYWSRPFERLPDDPALHYCVLAHLSDMGVGEGPLGPRLRGSRTPSVDHAVWFHRPPRMDDWVLFVMEPELARGGRLLYSGKLYDRSGERIATVMQECLAR